MKPDKPSPILITSTVSEDPNRISLADYLALRENLDIITVYAPNWHNRVAATISEHPTQLRRVHRCLQRKRPTIRLLFSL